MYRLGPTPLSDRTTSGRPQADRRLRASLATSPSPSDHLPTDWWHEPQTRDRQHAQRQIQQELQHNINLSHPQRGTVPISINLIPPNIFHAAEAATANLSDVVILVADRAYTDFGFLNALALRLAFFVVREKTNLVMEAMGTLQDHVEYDGVSKSTQILQDEIVRPSRTETAGQYTAGTGSMQNRSSRVHKCLSLHPPSTAQTTRMPVQTPFYRHPRGLVPNFQGFKGHPSAHAKQYQVSSGNKASATPEQSTCQVCRPLAQ